MRRPSSAAFVVASAWAARLVTAFVGIYSLRVLSALLTPAEYAVFVVIVGLAGWYALAGDPGIGYATQNAVTRKLAAKEDAGEDILSAYLMLGAAAALVALLTLAFSGVLSARLFASFQPLEAGSYESTLWWSGLVFAVAAAAGASSKILYAAHRGYVANIVTAIASVTGFVVLTAGLASSHRKVLFAVGALYGVPMLLALALAARQAWRARAARHRVERRHFASLWRAARGFLLFNVIAAAVLQVDYIIMSQKVESLEIVQYYNIAKLFAFSSFFSQAVMFAVWPRFTQQFAEGKADEVSRALGKLVLLGVPLALGTTLFVLFAAKPLAHVLSPGTHIEFRATVVGGFGALALIRCLTDPYAVFLQSIGRTRPLIVFAAVQAPISAGLQWVLAGWLGVEGILVALVLSFLLTVAWGLPRAARLSLAAPAAP